MLDRTELLVDLIGRGVERYTGSFRGPTPLLTVRYDNQKDADIDNPLDVSLSWNDTHEETVHKIATAFLLRHLPQAKHRLPDAAGSVSWLAAAVFYDVVVLNRYLGTAGRPDYQPVFTLFEKGHPPDVQSLLDNPVSPKWPQVYRLYAVHCHLLANLVHGIESPPPRLPLARYLNEYSQGGELHEALHMVISSQSPAEINLQEWYNQQAPRLAIRNGSMRSAESTKKALKKILTVSIPEEKVEDDSEPTGTTEEYFLPDYKGTLPPRPGLAEKVKQLLSLQQASPLLLRPALQDYTTAMSNLYEKGRLRKFRRQAKRAAAKLKKAANRHKAMHTYLDLMEIETGSVTPSVKWGFDIIRDRKQRVKKLQPRIEQYLDQIEAP